MFFYDIIIYKKNKRQGVFLMKKILFIFLVTGLCSSCMTLSLNAGPYGTSIGVGLRSKDGTVSVNQNVNLNK